MTEVLDNILVNLRILSKIKANEKLSVTNNTICVYDNTSKFNQITRTIKNFLFKNDNRDTTISFVNTLIDSSFEYSNRIMNSRIWTEKSEGKYQDDEAAKDRAHITSIFEELNNSQKGLESLRMTYADDPHLMAQLEIIQNKCKTKLSLIDSFLNSQNSQHSQTHRKL